MTPSPQKLAAPGALTQEELQTVQLVSPYAHASVVALPSSQSSPLLASMTPSPQKLVAPGALTQEELHTVQLVSP